MVVGWSQIKDSDSSTVIIRNFLTVPALLSSLDCRSVLVGVGECGRPLVVGRRVVVNPPLVLPAPTLPVPTGAVESDTFPSPRSLRSPPSPVKHQEIFVNKTDAQTV